VATYAADCITPQSVFTLGDTVCAQAGDFPVALTGRFRRFQWGAPDTSVADLSFVKVDPQYDSFIIPTTGALAQVGTWYVKTINASGEGHAVAKFTVRHPTIRAADLWITKPSIKSVVPGEQVMFTLQVGNPGPDYAQSVEFVTEVPSNMIFSGLRQASGGYFECSTPVYGEPGRTVCTTKYLKAGDKAEFHFYYQVNRDVREGTVCSGATVVSSYTEELNKSDNFWNTDVTVDTTAWDGGGGGEEP
jgi:uncharacterized repeat protein (TIGR01451 family)